MNQSFLLGDLTSAFNYGSDALRVFSVAMQVESHNIANISTRNFIPQKELLTTGANGRGVQLQAVLRDAPNHGFSSGFSEEIKRTQNTGSPSGTELAIEIPRLISTSSSIEANAKTITTIDEMYEYIVDMKA